MAIIYKGTNLITGKSYIGQTKLTLEWRLYNSWCGHITRARAGSHKHICGAIAKYGENNFKWEIIESIDATNLTKEELQKKLDEREIYWIDYFDTFNNGYNQTKGSTKHYGCSSIKGRIYVHNDFEDKIIPRALLDTYIAKGYKQGRSFGTTHYLSDEEKQARKQRMQEHGTLDKLKDNSKTAEANKGSKVLYKDGIKKTFKAKEYEQALKDGWLPFYKYLDAGYTLPWVNEGKPVTLHVPKFKLLYKAGRQKRIKLSEVEDYLSAGWLPYKEYLATGGQLSWRFPKRKNNEDKI